jgi:hypothetical protein
MRRRCSRSSATRTPYGCLSATGRACSATTTSRRFGPGTSQTPTSGAGVSRVRTSASPARERVSMASEAASGGTGSSSFAWYDRESSSWKTSQLSLLGGWTPYSGPWPAWGSMRSGRVSGRVTWGHPIDGGGSSSLPTPSATPYGSSVNGVLRSSTEKARPGAGRPSLDTMARHGTWPTPTAGDAKGAGSRNLPGSKAHAGVSLTDAVRFGNSSTAAGRWGPPCGAGLAQWRWTPGERPHPAAAGAGWWAAEPNVGRVAHGVSSRVDRLRCLGNAVVPQVAYRVGLRVRELLEAQS